jgi:hypothetical protein
LDTAAADPQVDRTVRDRERPDRERQVEVAVRVHPPERAHRRPASDRLECPDQLERARLGAAGDGAAGEDGVEQLGERHAGTQLALDSGDEVRDARELSVGEELGPPHRAGDAHA